VCVCVVVYQVRGLFAMRDERNKHQPLDQNEQLALNDSLNSYCVYNPASLYRE
jgi:hypothetical protein